MLCASDGIKDRANSVFDAVERGAAILLHYEEDVLVAVAPLIPSA